MADGARAPAIAPDEARAHVGRAEVLRDRGAHGRAKADCNEAVRVELGAPQLSCYSSTMTPAPRKPPSTAMISPVTKLERVPSSRNSMTLAISSGLA